MGDAYQDDTAEFPSEEVETIARQAIQNVLNADTPYLSKKVNEWCNAIVTSCLKELQTAGRPFKYVMTCVIMQNTGAALNTSASMHWDTNKDGHCKVPWKNNTMHVIVTIYGTSVNIEDPQDMD